MHALQCETKMARDLDHTSTRIQSLKARAAVLRARARREPGVRKGRLRAQAYHLERRAAELDGRADGIFYRWLAS